MIERRSWELVCPDSAFGGYECDNLPVKRQQYFGVLFLVLRCKREMSVRWWNLTETTARRCDGLELLRCKLDFGCLKRDEFWYSSFRT